MPLFRPGKPYRIGTLSADTAYASGISTVPYDVFDSDGEFGSSTSGGRVEIAIAGLYLMVHTGSKTLASGGHAYQPSIYIGGTVRGKQSQPTNSGFIGGSVSLIRQLAVGAIIDFEVNTSAAGTHEADATSMAIVRIGPVLWT